MQANAMGWKFVLLGAAMAIGGATGGAEAKTHSRTSMSHVSSAQSGTKHVHIGGHGRKYAYYGERSLGGYASYGGGIQCVPFARENSGIELSGNASAWWEAAEGVYERGSRPEVGSVLNFRANGRMHSGHVAVVANVDGARTVEIDHANWAGSRGGVARNVSVVDVSPANDWSAVRVALGRAGEFGSIYPTYGFIYDRPDHGTMVANNVRAPMPNALNPAPRDLRPSDERLASGDEPVEVAEAFTRVRYVHGRPSHRHGDAGATRVSHRRSEYGAQPGWGRSRRRY